MSPTAAITRSKELVELVRSWSEGFFVASRPHRDPVPVRNGDFVGQLSAKEKGDWYLHTVLGR